MRMNAKNRKEVVQKAVDALKEGKIVLHPTETCYGLAVDPTNEEALRALYEMKKMPDDKPLSIMVSSVDMADLYGLFSDYAKTIVEQFWPGPVSIMVMKRKESLPEFFNPGQKFVSIRYSSDPFSMEMVEKFGKSIVTTSANLAGKLENYSVTDLKKQFGTRRFGQLGFVVDAGKIPKNPPSTIVKIVGDTTVFVRGDGKQLGGMMR
ncbi:MAG: L-threonylcarbamoyladenylate synthase [Candidatus Gracilibacteria bacterium]